MGSSTKTTFGEARLYQNISLSHGREHYKTNTFEKIQVKNYLKEIIIFDLQNADNTDNNRKSGLGQGNKFKNQICFAELGRRSSQLQKVCENEAGTDQNKIDNLIDRVIEGSDIQSPIENNIYDIKTYTKIEEGVTILFRTWR